MSQKRPSVPQKHPTTSPSCRTRCGAASLTVPRRSREGGPYDFIRTRSFLDVSRYRHTRLRPHRAHAERATLTLAYSPPGDEVVAAVTRRLTQSTGTSGFQPCPGSDPTDPTPPLCQNAFYREDSQRTDVHLFRIHGGQETALWSIPGKDMFWLGVAEDGGQAVNGEAAVTDTWTYTGSQIIVNPRQITGCGVAYRAYRTGTAVRQLIATASDMCADIGRGTITPAPRRSTTGR